MRSERESPGFTHGEEVNNASQEHPGYFTRSYIQTRRSTEIEISRNLERVLRRAPVLARWEDR
jgi:hypothetical protein